MVLNRKKPAGRPKNAVVEVLPIDQLHLDWNGHEELRDRVLDGGDMLVTPQGEDIPSVVANYPALQPMVTRMSMTTSRPMPVIETLRDEVESFYLKNTRGKTLEDSPDVVAIAWKLRKMLGFIKMKVRRHEVSSVPFLN